MSSRIVFAAVLFALCHASLASAEAISINIGSDVQDVPGFGTTFVGGHNAGVVSVGHWNDINTGQLQANRSLDDSTGTATGLTLSTSQSFYPTGSAYSMSAAGLAPAFTVDAAGNNAMMNGYAYRAAGDGPIDLTFTIGTWVPYCTFDLYVYYNAGQAGAVQTFSLLNGTTTLLSKNGREPSPSVAVTGFAESDGTATGPGNYVKFAAVSLPSTLTSFTLRTSGATAYNYISGLQIVDTTPTPEPSACVLLALGMIGLLAYAWRNHK